MTLIYYICTHSHDCVKKSVEITRHYAPDTTIFVLSDRKFLPESVLLSEKDRRRPKNIDPSIYFPKSYDRILYFDQHTRLKDTIPLSSGFKATLSYSTVGEYSTYLNPQERKDSYHTRNYAPCPIQLPKDYQSYFAKRKELILRFQERESLIFTLLWLRDFPEIQSFPDIFE